MPDKNSYFLKIKRSLYLFYYKLLLSFKKVKAISVNIEGTIILFSIDKKYPSLLIADLLSLKKGALHEKNAAILLTELLKNSTSFVDVGVYIGYYTCLASKLMPKGTVYSFEMDKVNFTIAQKNVALNGCKNVAMFNLAVSDITGEAVSYIKKPDTFPSEFSFSPEALPGTLKSQNMQAQTISLDDFFKDKNALPDVVKIDVEGAEMKVLNGMKNILTADNVKLLVEVHPEQLPKFRSSSRDVILFLLDNKFQVFEIGGLRDQRQKLELKPLDEDSRITENTMLYAHQRKS